MPKLFKKILCPIQFDDNSIAALDQACELAHESDATLYVMNVVFLPLAALEPRHCSLKNPAGLLWKSWHARAFTAKYATNF